MRRLAPPFHARTLLPGQSDGSVHGTWPFTRRAHTQWDAGGAGHSARNTRCHPPDHPPAPRRREGRPVPRPSRAAYFSFFLMRSSLVCPHFFLRQLVARAGRRA
jgi:hypothetical protein